MPTVQIRSKGAITLPAKIRNKYNFQEGDFFTLLDLENGSFLLKPGISKVDTISAKVEKNLRKDGVTLEEILETLGEVRKEMFQERYGNVKKSSKNQSH
jgi:AbrB family looped-hinge helix DNA binding protein